MTGRVSGLFRRGMALSAISVHGLCGSSWVGGLTASFAATIFLLWAAVFATLSSDRATALERADHSVHALAARVQQRTYAKVSQMDMLTQIAKRQYEKSPVAFDLDSDLPHGSLTPDAALQVTIVGEDGRVVQSSSGRGMGINLSDREHFQVHKADAHMGLFIGHPVTGRISRERTVQLSRRLNRSDGTFAGVVVVSVNPDFLTDDAYTRAALGRDGLIAVVKGGGGDVLSARTAGGPVNSQDEGLLLLSDVFPPLRKPAHEARPEATYLEVAEPIPGYPIYVIADRSKDEIPNFYRNEHWLYLWAGAGTLVVIAVFAWMVWRPKMRESCIGSSVRAWDDVRASMGEQVTPVLLSSKSDR